MRFRYETLIPRCIDCFSCDETSPLGRPLPAHQTLLVHNANLIDVAKGELFTETALLIRGKRIVKRLSNADSSNIHTDRIINAQGYYIIPGLINNHAHITFPGVYGIDINFLHFFGKQIDRNCIDCIKSGVTTVRDQLGFQALLVDRQKCIANGELMGPRIFRGIALQLPGYFGATKIPIQRGTTLFDWLVSDAVLHFESLADAEASVHRAINNGADHIKLVLQKYNPFDRKPMYPQMPAEMVFTIINTASRLGYPTAVHVDTYADMNLAISAGAQSIEHVPCDKKFSDDDFARLRDNGSAIVPTRSAAVIFSCIHLAQKLQRDSSLFTSIREMIDKYLTKELHPLCRQLYQHYFEYKREKRTTKSLSHKAAEYFSNRMDLGQQALEQLYFNQCRIGCGNDGGLPFIWPGALGYEMQWLEQIGIPPKKILQAATLTNAEILGRLDDLGSIEPGKLADLVILSASPLNSMKNILHVDAVIQEGRFVHTTGEITENVT